MNKSRQSKAYSIISLVSGFLIHMTFGATYTLGTVTPYIASYIFYHSDPNIKVVDLSAIYPINMMFQSFGIALSMIFLQKKLDYRPLAFIGMVGFVGSYLIASFVSSLSLYLTFYSAMAGLFQGIAYMIPFRNCYEYLPNRKGLCSGICMTAYGAGSFLFNWIILKLVNPQNQVPNQKHIFSRKVAENFPIALRQMCIIYILIGSIGCSLIIRKKSILKIKSNRKNDKQIQYGQQSQANIEKSLITQTNQVQNEQIQKQISPENSIKKLLKKKQFYQLVLLLITSVPFGAFLAYNYKQYGETVSKDDSLITLTGSIGGVTNSLSRIFWCFLLDYFPFQKITLTMSIVNLGLICGFYFNSSQQAFIILTISTYFFYGAHFGIYPTQTIRIYGEQDGSRVYPFVFGGFTLSACLQFILHFVVITEYGDAGFKYCFIAFGILQFTSIILLLKFKFRYRQSQKILLLGKQSKKQQKNAE